MEFLNAGALDAPRHSRWCVMGHPTVLVLSSSEAAMYLRQGGGAGVVGIVSIGGARESAPDAATIANRLVLEFDDVDVPDPSDPLDVYACWARDKWARENGRPVVPPTREDAARIIEFARATAGATGIVICHCHGGVSRSPAAALLCLAEWAGRGRETECVDELLRVRPCAAPHPGLVRFGDELLGREGELIHALRIARNGDR
jgi:predicted protein tyrosine phosphatase